MEELEFYLKTITELFPWLSKPGVLFAVWNICIEITQRFTGADFPQWVWFLADQDPKEWANPIIKQRIISIIQQILEEK